MDEAPLCAGHMNSPTTSEPRTQTSKACVSMAGSCDHSCDQIQILSVAISTLHTRVMEVKPVDPQAIQIFDGKLGSRGRGFKGCHPDAAAPTPHRAGGEPSRSTGGLSIARSVGSPE